MELEDMARDILPRHDGRVKRIEPITILIIISLIAVSATTVAGVAMAINNEVVNNAQEEAIELSMERIDRLELQLKRAIERLEGNDIRLGNTIKFQSAITAVHNQLNAYRRQKQRMMNGIRNLINGKLEPTLVTPDKLREAFQQVRTNLVAGGVLRNEKDCDLPSIYTLYRDSPNVVTKPNGDIYSTFNIDIIKPGKGYPVFEHIRVPHVNPLTGEMVFLGDDNEILIQHYLEDTYAIMSKHEYFECKRTQGEAICHSQNIRYTHYNDTCLGTLYKRNLTRAFEICPQQRAPPGIFVRNLNKHTFVIVNHKPITIREQCHHAEPVDIKINGSAVIRIDEGCNLTTSDIRIVLPDTQSANVEIGVEFEWDAKAEIRTLMESAHPEIVTIQPEVLELFDEHTNIGLGMKMYREAGNAGGIVGTSGFIILIGVILLALYLHRRKG